MAWTKVSSTIGTETRDFKQSVHETDGGKTLVLVKHMARFVRFNTYVDISAPSANADDTFTRDSGADTGEYSRVTGKLVQQQVDRDEESEWFETGSEVIVQGGEDEEEE